MPAAFPPYQGNQPGVLVIERATRAGAVIANGGVRTTTAGASADPSAGMLGPGREEGGSRPGIDKAPNWTGIIRIEKRTRSRRRCPASLNLRDQRPRNPLDRKKASPALS